MATISRCDRCGRECRGGGLFGHALPSTVTVHDKQMPLWGSFIVEAMTNRIPSRDPVDFCQTCRLIYLDELRALLVADAAAKQEN